MLTVRADIDRPVTIKALQAALEAFQAGGAPDDAEIAFGRPRLSARTQYIEVKWG